MDFCLDHPRVDEIAYFFVAYMHTSENDSNVYGGFYDWSRIKAYRGML